MKNLTQYVVEKLFLDPFLKKLSISLCQQSKLLHCLLLLYAKLRVIEIYWNIVTRKIIIHSYIKPYTLIPGGYAEAKPRRPLAFNSYKAFLENKKRSYILLTDQISLFHFLYLVRYYRQYEYCNCLLTSFWSHKF